MTMDSIHLPPDPLTPSVVALRVCPRYRPRFPHRLFTTALTTGLLILSLAGTGRAQRSRPVLDDPIDPRIASRTVRLQSLTVSVDVDEGMAVTQLREILRNDGGRVAEARFVLPLPPGAVVHDASLRIDGKLVEAEILPAGQARAAYQDIVRRMIDPALIEYLDEGLLSTRVFPIPPGGTRELTLSLTVALPEDFGTWSYRLPLKALCGGHLAPEQLAVEGIVRSHLSLQAPYSPTHALEVNLDADGHRASFSLENKGELAARDVLIQIPSTRERMGVWFASSRPAGEDGFFLARIQPGEEQLAAAKDARKRIVFVLDTSGSMEGEKFQQAKAAVRYCLTHLGREDSFGILTYASTVRWMSNGVEAASPKALSTALAELDRLSARGGTNIEAALNSALDELKRANHEPTYVLFLSDGLPTVGEQSIDTLLALAKTQNQADARLFTFGVGYDVNTRLLDGLASGSRALVRYVLPGEDLEESVSNLYSQIAQPLWTDLALKLNGAGLYDMSPTELGDLHRGATITVLGRYRNPGHFRLVLSGRQDSARRSFSQTVELANRATMHDYIARLWASRRIAFLQSMLRAEGRSQELIDEIVDLGLRYGIVTEYTSFLIKEPNAQVARAQREGRGIASMPMAAREEMDALVQESSQATGKVAVNRAKKESKDYAADAALVPDAPAKLQSNERWSNPGERANAGARMQLGRWIFRADAEGRWVDHRAEGADPRLEIKAYSQAWFELAEMRPELRSVMGLGSTIRIVVGREVLEIGDEGVETLSAKDRHWLASSPI
jgi:Ca-activated chloride channel family protein